MAEAVADTIKAADHAADTLSRPGVLGAVLAFLGAVAGIGGCGWMVYRNEVRADAQTKVLERIADKLADLDQRFTIAGVPKLAKRAHAAADIPVADSSVVEP